MQSCRGVLCVWAYVLLRGAEVLNKFYRTTRGGRCAGEAPCVTRVASERQDWRYRSYVVPFTCILCEFAGARIGECGWRVTEARTCTRRRRSAS